MHSSRLISTLLQEDEELPTRTTAHASLLQMAAQWLSGATRRLLQLSAEHYASSLEKYMVRASSSG